MTQKLYLILLISILSSTTSASILNWFWKKSEESTVLVSDGVPLIDIPYEAMTEDEKFLQEAAKFTSEIQISSPLEVCQHKVVMKIKTSCSEMAEEDLAKLSVNLLNCQSAVEGRKLFPCSEEMSLKQCTTDMDADMWNAYHLMSNRARAVCYAARNTQFRALTELTVNKLMHSAQSQISALNTLKDGQERLETQTIEALSSLTEGSKNLIEQQKNLKDAQITAYNLVTTNLRELNNEKALIRTGHTLLLAMTEDIKNKLEKASLDLMQQAVERGDNHREVLDDLSNIQDQARLIWDKVESSTDEILLKHEKALKQYELTLEKLAQINETIQYIWNVTTTMRTEMDQKLGWLTNYIGNTGEQLQKVYRTALHIVYILVAMIVAAFLNAPFLTRATILGIIPINLISYLKHGTKACLDFPSITVLIFLITAMHYIMVGIQYIFGPHPQKLQSENIQNKSTMKNEHKVTNGHTIKYAALLSSSESMFSTAYITDFSESISRHLKTMCQHIIFQINYCIEKIGNTIYSTVAWSRGDLTPQEELSCSYMPEKKNHNDVIYNYGAANYPSFSDDTTDVEESHDTFGSDNFDRINDANNIRTQIRSSSAVRQRNSISRSVTPSPSYTSPRMLCCALTRTGRKCRLFAAHGGNFCSRHNTGSSVMGD